MAKWIEDPQGRDEVEKVTEELKLPVWQPWYKGKFREFWNECWGKIEDNFLKLKNLVYEKCQNLEESKFDKSGGTINGEININYGEGTWGGFNILTDDGFWQLQTHPQSNESGNKRFNMRFINKNNEKFYLHFPDIKDGDSVAYQNWVSNQLNNVEPKFNKNSGFNLDKTDSYNSDSSNKVATARAVKRLKDWIDEKVEDLKEYTKEKLSDKLNLTGGTLTGDLTIDKNNPTIFFNRDVSIGVENENFVIREPEDDGKKWLEIIDDEKMELFGNKILTENSPTIKGELNLDLSKMDWGGINFYVKDGNWDLQFSPNSNGIDRRFNMRFINKNNEKFYLHFPNIKDGDSVAYQSHLTEMLGARYDSDITLNSDVKKYKGRAYYDNNTEKMYICTKTNSYRSAATDCYIPFDNKSLLDKINKKWRIVFNEYVNRNKFKVNLSDNWETLAFPNSTTDSTSVGKFRDNVFNSSMIIIEREMLKLTGTVDIKIHDYEHDGSDYMILRITDRYVECIKSHADLYYEFYCKD